MKLYSVFDNDQWVADMTADDIDCLFQLTQKIRENLIEDLECSMKNKCCEKKDNKEANHD